MESLCSETKTLNFIYRSDSVSIQHHMTEKRKGIVPIVSYFRMVILKFYQHLIMWCYMLQATRTHTFIIWFGKFKRSQYWQKIAKLSWYKDTVCMTSSWQWRKHAFTRCSISSVCMNLIYAHVQKEINRYVCTTSTRLHWRHYQLEIVHTVGSTIFFFTQPIMWRAKWILKGQMI